MYKGLKLLSVRHNSCNIGVQAARVRTSELLDITDVSCNT